jgi:Ran GTPase-activating protein (RanGAP) involved in mRNA processing and transport
MDRADNNGEDEIDEDGGDEVEINENDDDVGDDEEEEMKMKDEKDKFFIRNFHNGNYDVEFDDKLSSDRGIIIAARPTQASYNKPDNWVERNHIGLEEVIQQLLTCIDWVKRDLSVQLKLTHNVYGHQLMDNEEPIVWNEPILDEYWVRLEAEIDRRKRLDNVTTDIERIQIENIEMKEERMAALVAIFRSGKATNSFQFIQFINVNLCGEGIVSLSKLINVSVELDQLHLYHNRIDNMESARCLSSSLKSHNLIDLLSLDHCDLGSNPEILLVILQSDIKYIDLENNNIDSLGAVTIAEYLESNPPIQHINLGHNRLNDDDVILISQALKRNTNLKTINLLMNNLTSIGVKALLTCVFDSSSLNAISESNHTLGRMNIFLQDDELEDCIDRLLELDRTEKILLALRDKDSLLKYLANVPVVLIPEVLAFSQLDGIECDCINLSIVYSTMRWWNMPMLYSYHSCVKSDTKRKRDN